MTVYISSFKIISLVWWGKLDEDMRGLMWFQLGHEFAE